MRQTIPPAAASPRLPEITRRGFLAVAGATTVVSATGFGPARAAERPASMHAIASDTVRASFGVNTHVTWRDTPYAANDRCRAAVISLIESLGASWWRERAAVVDPTQIESARKLAARGCRQLAIIGDRDDLPEHLAATVASLPEAYGRAFPQVIRAVSGVNEPNVSGWSPAEVVAQQRAIYRAARSHPAFRKTPIVAPALMGQVEEVVRDFRRLRDTDIAHWCDAADIHYYPPGRAPGYGLHPRLHASRKAFGTRRIFCSENGYVDQLSQQQGYAIPEKVAGVYAPRMLLELIKRGVRATMSYELLDQSNRANDDWMGYFGLVDSPGNDPSRWRRKPSYRALRRLIAITRDDGRAHDPRPLRLHLESEVPVRHLLLSRRDGSHMLLLWRDTSIYDPVRRERINVRARRSTIVLDTRHDLRVVGVSSGASRILKDVRRAHFPIGAEVVAVHIR
jgi:hypothetical protein